MLRRAAVLKRICDRRRAQNAMDPPFPIKKQNIEMKKREEILNQHPYSIWQGKTNGS